MNENGNPPADLMPTPKIPFEWLRKADASYEQALLELSRQMSDEMLKQIATADYGFKAEECFAYLKTITSTQQLPTQTEFILTECLELTRWTKPKDRSEHLCRAFSCMLLLILERTSDYHPVGEINDFLAPLVDSLTALQLAQKSTQELLIWRILADYEHELAFYLEEEEDKEYIAEITINPFLIYALLLMMIVNNEPQTHIASVLDWNIEMEKSEKNIPPYYSAHRAENMTQKEHDSPFLLAFSGNFRQYHGLWSELSLRMIPAIPTRYPAPMKQQLEDIFDCVGHQKPMKF